MSDRANPTISLVIPVFREGEHLQQSLGTITKEMDSVGEPYEIVLVDDGSPDNSWEVIVEESRRNPRLRGLRLSRNFGKEAALCAGLDAAAGRAVVIMDADLQHPPALIPEMVRLWRSGQADVIEAVKQGKSKEPLGVKLRRRVFYAFMNKCSGFDLSAASDFKLIDASVRDAWLKMGEKNLFFRGMIAWLGFRHIQIPFVVPERVSGKSGWSFLALLRLSVTGLTAFSNLPVRFASLIGVIFLFFAVGFGIYAIALKIAGVALSGFTTVILLQLVIGSGLFLALGVIGEYVGRTYEEVKNRPRYVVSEVAGPQAAGRAGRGAPPSPANPVG
jgi:glycosyltransferase involved in cell wall biosynthesis